MSDARIGVFICECEGLISDRLDTERVAAAAASLDSVVLVRRPTMLCSRAGLAEFTAELQDAGINRVLFAGCSPRSSLKFPEQQLSRAMDAAGVDSAFLEAANLREQCAWLHPDHEAATAKGIDLVRMAHARLCGASPSDAPSPVVQRSLVVGGGAAGLATARSLAAAGQEVTIVERDAYLGGRLCQVGFLFQCEGHAAYCRSECVGPVQAMEAVVDPRITLMMQSEIRSIAKMDGNFQVRIAKGAPFVDGDRCTSCGACAEICPQETVSEYNHGLYRRKAIDKDFERAVPETYNIVDAACTRCGDCLAVCPTAAIDLEARPDLVDEEFGAVFLATGFEHPGLDDQPELARAAANVVSGLEMERLMDHGMSRPSDGELPQRVVFNLCSGSRATLDRRGKGVPYCSKTCCGTTVKQAERIVAAKPMTEVVILYNHDIRTYERALESWYVRLKALGVEFVNAQLAQVTEQEDGSLKLRLDLAAGEDPDLDDAERSEDSMLLDADLLVLAAAQVPSQGSRSLMDQLGVLADVHGFPVENQVRLFRPTETLVDRVFAVGAAVGPKVVQQSVEQGSAAAMKALPVLMSGSKPLLKHRSSIAEGSCIRCGSCIAVCPHGAIRMTDDGAVSDPAFCQGCGFCAAACPTHAAQLLNFSDRQILDQAAVAFEELPAGEPKILALLCYWCSYSGGDLAGVKGMSAPASFRSIRIRCSSSVNSGLIMEIFRLGVDGVLVAGCPDRSCHHAWGNYLSDRRVTLLRTLMGQLGLAENRLRFEYIGVPQSAKFVATIEAMDRELRELGPNPIPTLVRN